LDLDRYGLGQGLASITPGTRILALCAAVAWMLRGWRGALAAVLAASVPSTLIVVLLTWAFPSFERDPVALGVLAALLASAIGLMWAAAWLLIRSQIRRATWPRVAVVTLGAFLALARWSISPIQVLAAAAIVGFLWAGDDDA